MGQRVSIYGPLGPTEVELGSPIFDGPSDDRFTVDIPGLQPAPRDMAGDLIFDPYTPEFDCAHAYGVARLTLEMFQAAHGRPIPWRHDRHLIVIPHFGRAVNAFYAPDAGALAFGWFTPSGTADRFYTVRSFDVVAHEATHAVLDGMKPGWVASTHPHSTALHESVADLAVVFLTVSLTGGVPDTSVAEEFAEAAFGSTHGVRNARNSETMNDPHFSPHELSRVFTGAVYDALVDLVRFNDDRVYDNRASSLGVVAKLMLRNLVQAIRNSPTANVTFADVAGELVASFNQKEHSELVREQFVKRGVLT